MLRILLIAAGLVIPAAVQAQDAPKTIKTVRVLALPPGSSEMYTVDADGTVRIDWTTVETVASSKSDRTVLPIAELMLAIRDGTWRPLP